MLKQQDTYAKALEAYDKGYYDSAYDLFLVLSSQLPFDASVWQGLAACEQNRQDFTASLSAWSMATLLDPADPYPYFHSAECLIAQNHFVEAQKALNKACSLPCTETLLQQIDSLKKVVSNGLL